MSIFDRLKKKAPKPDSVSEGGFYIYHYEENEQKGWRAPEAYGSYTEEICDYFSKVFPGRKTSVLHELLSDLVHIDVNIMSPTEDNNFYVIYTTGMSDLPMSLPEGYEDREDLKYAELYAFMPPTWNPGSEFRTTADIPDSEYWIIHMIKYLARFPHEYSTWLGDGHTIPNGPDYEPIAGGTTMGGVVLKQLGQSLECIETDDGKKIKLLMLIPAYQEEIEYKLKYGMQKLDEVFAEKNIPLVIDLQRPNYCEDFKERLD